MRLKTLSLFLVSSFTVLLSACSEYEPLCGCTNIDIVTRIIVTDSENRNLLDPSTPDHFKEEDIRIYYVKNGEREEVFNPNLDIARSFKIEQYGTDSEYAMKLFPDMEAKDSETTTTIIKWSTTSEDTVECEIHHEGGSTTITKVWYDGELAYDVSKSPTSTGEYLQRLIRVK